MFYILKRHLHGCIVGSGPSGLYLAQNLLNISKKNNQRMMIDIFEKLPIPYGLVRFGVAPDHQDVKTVINSFEKTLGKPNVKLLAGIDIGNEIKLKDLKNAYDYVVLCYGQFGAKKLDIEGKSLKNIYAGQEIVGWYNGFPNNKVEIKNLSNIKNLTIIGMGNVAIDVARILSLPNKSLNLFDIPDCVVKVLETSNISKINIVGRRDISKASFTIKEFREISQLENLNIKINPNEFNGIDFKDIPQNKSRLLNLMKEISNNYDTISKGRILNYHFNLTPKSFVGNGGIVESINFINPDKKTVNIPSDMVVECIGYQGTSIDESIKFDFKNGCLYNNDGRIIDPESNQNIPKLYCSGWIKTGPKGTIANNVLDSYLTANIIMQDFVDFNKSGEYNESQINNGAEEIIKLLKEKNINFVDFNTWKIIDEVEKTKGFEKGKLREKILNWEDITKFIKK